MKEFLFAICFFSLFCLLPFHCLADSMPAPVTPTPPNITPGSGGEGSSSSPYIPGSSYGSSRSKHEFRGVFEGSLKLTQSLWEGGATSAQIAIQRARLGTATSLLEDAASALAFDAIACHVDILRRREMVRLAEENTRSHETILAALRNRVRDGLATVGDVHQVQSRLSRAQGSLAEYISYLQATEANFLRITGRRAPNSLTSAPRPPYVYKSTAEASAACQEKNPRIIAALAEIDAYEGEKKLADSRNYPQLSAEAGPRWYFQDTRRDQTNHGVDAMLVLRWNLYEGGATKSAKEAAAAKKRQARQVLHRTMDVYAEDIDATWARHESAQKQSRHYEQGMMAAKAARVSFYEQYMLGTRSLLDVLDAENDYFTSASQYMIAEGDITIAAWRLLALGGDILRALKVDVEALKIVKASEVEEENNLTRAAARNTPDYAWKTYPAGKAAAASEPRKTAVSSGAVEQPRKATATSRISDEPRETSYRTAPAGEPRREAQPQKNGGPLQVLAAYADRRGNDVACKLSMRNSSGRTLQGSIQAVLLNEAGGSRLTVENPDYTLRQGLEKRFVVKLPRNAPATARIRLDVLDSSSGVIYSRTLGAN